MRRFLGLLLGTATVVGFEVTFGINKWKPFGLPMPMPKPMPTDLNLLPGGITYVRNIEMLSNGYLIGTE